MAYIKIRIRGDTADNWATRNPILEEREMAVEVQSQTSTPWKMKIGDGQTRWNDLPYSFDYDSINDLKSETNNYYLQTKQLYQNTLSIQSSFNETLTEINEDREAFNTALDQIVLVRDEALEIKEEIDEIVNSSLIAATQDMLDEIKGYLEEINSSKDSFALHVDAGDANTFDVQNIMGGNASTVDPYKYEAGNALSVIN